MIKRIARGAVALSFCSAIFMGAAPATFAASPHSNANARTSHGNAHSSHQTQQPQQKQAQTGSEAQQNSSYHAQAAPQQSSAPSSAAAPAAAQSSQSSYSSSHPSNTQAASSSAPAATYAVTHSSSPSTTKSTIPGNNGTVKIHATAGDTSPHNQPHVGCSFFVDYYHYDLNDMLSTSFAAHSPSGTGQLGGVDNFTITSSGSKSFNTERPYNLSSYLSGLKYNPQQGYHVKLSVDNQSAPGGQKHKVFWINCQQPPAGGGMGGGGGTTTPPTNTPPTGGGTGGGVTLTSSPRPISGGTGGSVLASSTPAPTGSPSSSIENLPYTGARDGLNVWIAILAVVGLSSAIYWRKAVMPLLRR